MSPLDSDSRRGKRATCRRWLIPIAGVLGVAFSIAYCSQFERDFIERGSKYEPIHYLKDEQTGKIVELGVLYNFSSTSYEVGVYDAADPLRDSGQLHVPMISTNHRAVNPEEVKFDGKCYYIVAVFDEVFSRVTKSWNDGVTGKSICFFLLTPEGRKIEEWPLQSN